MLRVARIIGRLNVGGPAQQLFGLTGALDALGWQTDVYAGVPGEAEGDLLGEAWRRGIFPTLVPGLSRDLRPWRDLRGLVQLLGALRRQRPDIIHTHLSKAGLLGRMAAAQLGIPCVHTFHGHVLRGYFSPARSALLLRVERWLARRTQALIALSPRLRDELVELGVACYSRLHVIRAARDLRGFVPDPQAGAALRARLGLPAAAVVLGMLGRLVEIKAPQNALAALARLRQHERLHLLLAGDGPLRAALAAQIERLGLGARCQLLGWQEPAPFVAGLDALLLCSHNEGTPISLLEAFACGIPAVATAVGGVPDMFSPGQDRQRAEGWLVPDQDAQALDAALSWMYNHPDERRAMGAQAVRRAATLQPDPQRQAREHDALYRSLLAATRNSQGA